MEAHYVHKSLISYKKCTKEFDSRFAYLFVFLFHGDNMGFITKIKNLE